MRGFSVGFEIVLIAQHRELLALEEQPYGLDGSYFSAVAIRGEEPNYETCRFAIWRSKPNPTAALTAAQPVRFDHPAIGGRIYREYAHPLRWLVAVCSLAWNRDVHVGRRIVTSIPRERDQSPADECSQPANR